MNKKKAETVFLMNLFKKAKRRVGTMLRQALEPEYEKKSYSQCGEDLIMEFLLKEILKIEHPTYLDIGAWHPVKYSNTYLFYKSGSRGVTVEPNPEMHALHRKKRPHDICLMAGVGGKSNPNQEFFVMDAGTLCTFSKEEAEGCVNAGHRILKTISIPILEMEKLIDDYFEYAPDLVSIDTEGYEITIIEAMGLKSRRPKALCIETLEYAVNTHGAKASAITNILADSGYALYASTNINTIYVDNGVLK